MLNILLQAVDSLTHADEGGDSTYLIPIFVIAILILIVIFSSSNDKERHTTEVRPKDKQTIHRETQYESGTINRVGEKVHLNKQIPKYEIPSPLTDYRTNNETQTKNGRRTSTPYINGLTELEVKVIVSSPDPTKSEPKRIGYEPNNHFKQNKPFTYPIVLMPEKGSLIKFPRKGRSDKKGFKEDSFKLSLDNHFRKNFQIFNDRHLPTESGRPYEPDFCLIYETGGKNIFINIEIDEPYDGWTRTPTHCNSDNDLRDKFLTKRGWLVIRFAEIQIHQNPKGCCELINEVISSIDNTQLFSKSDNHRLEKVKQWDSLQAKKWAKENYREKYLGINNFGQRPNSIVEYIIESSEIDSEVESKIPRNQLVFEEADTLARKNYHPRDTRVTFDPIEHRYFIDGNPDTISVTELISKFFPEFDKLSWSAIKADERGVSQEQILQEWEKERIDSADKGTKLHKAIEDYYNGRTTNYDSLEFQHFKSFKERYSTMVPYRSEWRIFDEDLMIAGTIDMVYKKDNGDLYMFDWKRSKKVVYENGAIRNDNFQTGFGDLGNLGDNSFNKYCLQQNIYKAILEKRYGQKISSVNILVLHPIYDKYFHLPIPSMDREVSYIFRQVLSMR